MNHSSPPAKSTKYQFKNPKNKKQKLISSFQQPITENSKLQTNIKNLISDIQSTIEKSTKSSHAECNFDIDFSIEQSIFTEKITENHQN